MSQPGTVTVELTWTPETAQTEELYAFLQHEDASEPVSARGTSPLVLTVIDEAGSYNVGIYVSGPARAGPLQQEAQWSATWAPSDTTE